MEPLTHFLTGACIGRAGLNRKTACATVVAVLAAEAADLDVLWGFDGPVEELKRHRGITHTFLGAPFVAAVIVAVVGFFYVWLERRRARKRHGSTPPPESPPSRLRKPPLRWFWLYATALIAALSHILLDWTNNYGVRPFFPFNPRWYAGSFMFIAEPVLWGLFLLALVVPWLLGLADREIGARRPVFRGRGWAIFALLGLVTLGCWRWAEHAQALNLIGNAQVTTSPVSRSAVEPYPSNLWRWHAIVETPGFYQTAEVNTRRGSVDSEPNLDVLYKPASTPAVEAAKQTPLGQTYLDWGTWAVVRDLGQQPIPGSETPRLPAGRTWTTVEFSDLRFAYAFTGGESKRPPSGLSGWVYILDNREDGGEFIGGREQK
jgi:inner membrane protein